MKERELSINRSDDPTLVSLDKKEKKELLKEVKDGYHAYSELYNRLENDNLDIGMKNILCSLAETHTVKMIDMLGHKSELAKEYNQRFEDIRATNIQNRELRKQLGEKASPEDVRECLKNIDDNIRKWWKKNGLGYPTLCEQTYKSI